VSQTYTGSAIEPCTASYTTEDGLSGSLTVSYTDNTNVGTAHASATYVGDGNHEGSSNSAAFEITKAASSVTVDCPVSQTYTGSAIEPCTASYTTEDGLSGSLTVSYTDNTNVGTATANASYAGDGNHEGSGNSKNFEITKAASSVTVTCTLSVVYTGSAQTPCNAKTTGVGMSDVDVSASLTYTDNVNVGSATANASWSGDANHDGSTGSSNFAITKAASSVTVDCPVSQTYTGSAIEPCTASYTTEDGLSGSLSVSYTDNTNVGTAHASATYAGDGNHEGSSNSAAFEITKAASSVTVDCPVSQTYTGSAIEPCTASYATEDGLSGSLTVSYTDNTNVGTAHASATYVGDGNHEGSSNSAAFEITKAASSVTVTCTLSVVYTGSAQTPCTAKATGVGMANVDVSASLTYTSNTNVGTATANASWGGDANHFDSNGSANFAITKASSSITVTCPVSVVYTGSAQTPCTAKASGAGMSDVDVSASLTYTGNTNVGTATANASYAGDANHFGSTGSGNFAITKASSSVIVTCPASVVYNGSAQTPCTAKVTSVGMSDVNVSAFLTYTGNTNVGIAAANASYAGDANHFGSTGSGNFTITKAPSTTTVSCPASVVYTGSAQTPCTASYSGVGGLSGILTPTYSNNVNVGTAAASASYAGDLNHDGSTGSKNFSIFYSTSACMGEAGHTILQPINADGSSIFKKGSTVPAKFRVCDAAGHSIGTAGVVTSFKVIFIGAAPASSVNETVDSTTPDTAFRWDSSAQQWIFNINTKSLSLNA
jgi:hypothetical protein